MGVGGIHEVQAEQLSIFCEILALKVGLSLLEERECMQVFIEIGSFQATNSV